MPKAERISYGWGYDDGRWWLVRFTNGEPSAAYHPEHGRTPAWRDTFSQWHVFDLGALAPAAPVEPAPEPREYDCGESVVDSIDGVCTWCDEPHGDHTDECPNGASVPAPEPQGEVRRLSGEDIRALIAELPTGEVLNLIKEDSGRIACYHCGAIPPADEEHWRVCEKHPARVEVERLQEQLEHAIGRINNLVGRHRLAVEFEHEMIVLRDELRTALFGKAGR